MWGGGARVSEFFFTKDPNLKNKKKYFFFLGGGGGVELVIFFSKNPNLNKRAMRP